MLSSCKNLIPTSVLRSKVFTTSSKGKKDGVFSSEFPSILSGDYHSFCNTSLISQGTRMILPKRQIGNRPHKYVFPQVPAPPPPRPDTELFPTGIHANPRTWTPAQVRQWSQHILTSSGFYKHELSSSPEYFAILLAETNGNELMKMTIEKLTFLEIPHHAAKELMKYIKKLLQKELEDAEKEKEAMRLQRQQMQSQSESNSQQQSQLQSQLQ